MDEAHSRAKVVDHQFGTNSFLVRSKNKTVDDTGI